jgi:hypothetical protein
MYLEDNECIGCSNRTYNFDNDDEIKRGRGKWERISI